MASYSRFKYKIKNILKNEIQLLHTSSFYRISLALTLIFIFLEILYYEFGIQINEYKAFVNNLEDHSNGILTLVTCIYVLFTGLLLKVSQKQINLSQTPIISVRIQPDESYFNTYYIYIHNTGNGAAYDLSLHFDPDLPYLDSSLNNLNSMKNISIILPGETIKFLFSSVPEYLSNPQNQRYTTIKYEYYRFPKKMFSNCIRQSINIDLYERINLMLIKEKTLSDVVKELEELKQGLLMILVDKKNGNN